MHPLSIVFLTFALLVPSSATRATSSADPVEVASDYLEALRSSDLDRAEPLFAKDSSVFESGGTEGSWDDYRAHHLGPEIDAITSFSVIEGEPDVASSHDGSLAFVAWPIEYRVELEDGRIVERKGTVTFVLVRENGLLRIRHLHWSSRAK